MLYIFLYVNAFLCVLFNCSCYKICLSICMYSTETKASILKYHYDSFRKTFHSRKFRFETQMSKYIGSSVFISLLLHRTNFEMEVLSSSISSLPHSSPSTAMGLSSPQATEETSIVSKVNSTSGDAIQYRITVHLSTL